MKRRNLIFIFVIFLTSTLWADEPWKLIKEIDGIKIFSKIDSNTQIKIIKAETEVKTTLSALFALFTDVSNQPNWVFSCESAEIIKKIDPFHWYYHTLSDAPWPVSDRDVVTYVSVLQDPVSKAIILTSNGVPDYIPEKQGYVRVPELKASWVLLPLPNGKIHVIFTIEINLGGFIPRWATNLFVSKGPYNTLKNLLVEIQKPKYKNAVVPLIKEPCFK